MIGGRKGGGLLTIKSHNKICVYDMCLEGTRRADARYRCMDASTQRSTEFTMNEVMIEVMECGREL